MSAGCICVSETNPVRRADGKYDWTIREDCPYHKEAAAHPQDHSIPWNCPTYYDGCNCGDTTALTARAEAAERELESADRYEKSESERADFMVKVAEGWKERDALRQVLIDGPGPTHGMRWAEWYASLMDCFPWMAEAIRTRKKGWLKDARLTAIASDQAPTQNQERADA